MNDPLFDVAIIGGGVAGCAAAIHLAQRSRKVILCESQSYPHHKVCGEFLSPECAVLLADLGLMPVIQAAKPASIHTVAIIAPDGITWESTLPGVAIGISRYALDNLMAQGARSCGVDFREGCTVTDVQGSLATTFTLTTRTSIGQQKIRAKTVIGAHGKRSQIDRTLKRSFLKSHQPFIGLKMHFRGTPLPGRIHLYPFPGGYCGLSDIEDGKTNVCLLVRQEVFQSIGHVSSNTIPPFIDWMKNQNPALGQWLSTAQPLYENWLTIAQIPFSDKELIAQDVLMIGDAAGLIAPVAGDGMGMALQASHIASYLLEQYLSNQISAQELRRTYTILWWRAFGLRLRLGLLLQAFMLRPHWLIPGLHLMNAVPVFGRLLVAHTRDARLAHL